MKKSHKIILVLLGAAFASLSSCSTVNGIGKDLSRAGGAISGSSR